MPKRISSVFELDRAGDKGKARFNAICGFGYSNEDVCLSENVALTPHAPCVADEELLARVLESPTHVELDMGLKYTPAAFSDAHKWGLSVQRQSLTTAEEINLFGEAKAKAKERTYVGYVKALTADLRSELSPQSNKRLLGIYATASADVPSHADIYAITNSREDKETVKAAFWLHFKLEAYMPALQAAAT